MKDDGLQKVFLISSFSSFSLPSIPLIKYNYIKCHCPILPRFEASDVYDSVAAWGHFKWMVERGEEELQQMVEIPEKSATAPPLRLKLLFLGRPKPGSFLPVVSLKEKAEG